MIIVFEGDNGTPPMHQGIAIPQLGPNAFWLAASVLFLDGTESNSGFGCAHIHNEGDGAITVTFTI
jgi:hypothetical protein